MFVRARDGIGLATDIYRPAKDGRPLDRPAPVILELRRTEIDHQRRRSRSADRAVTRAQVAAHFVRHGYVVIVSGLPWTPRSECEFTKISPRAADGFDAMSWIARQPMVRRPLGTMGLSYAAHTQLAAACLNPPGLRR